MRTLTAIAGLLLVAAPAVAQGGGGRQFTPPPDHWMTFDSLVAAVGITDAQKADAQKHYDALNAVLKQAAAKRLEMRSHMGAGPPSDEQRLAMREAMQKMQSDVEMHYGELRKLLNPDQQAKFDALPKPSLRMMGRRPPGQ